MDALFTFVVGKREPKFIIKLCGSKIVTIDGGEWNIDNEIDR